LFRDNAGKCVRSDAFITDGFCRWNNFKSFPEHVGRVDSFHNNVVMKCENLTKQGSLLIMLCINKMILQEMSIEFG